MLSWSTITYGAALSAVGAALLAAAAVRPRRFVVIALAAASAFFGPVCWNAILRATEADTFFVDASLSVFPISWQDTGSGVFTFAVAALLLGLWPYGRGTGRGLVVVALLSAFSSLVVDVYLY